MNKRLIFILLLVVIGLLLGIMTRYMPLTISVGLCLLVVLILVSQSFFSIHKKAVAVGPTSGPQTLSTSIMYISAIGAIVAFMLIVFHLHHIGRPLLNFSLILYIAGAALGIWVQARPGNNATSPRKLGSTWAKAIYLSSICIIGGLLMKINHFSGGEFVTIIGLLSVIVFLVFVLFAKKR